MKTCIIFCAAEFDALAEPVLPGDLLLAADGGLAHVRRLGLEPEGILGDFDSLGYVPEGAQVFPAEKDDTDAMLAVRHGLSRGFRRFVIYGGLGGPRLDHTMANFQTLQFLTEHGAGGYLVGRDVLVTAMQNETLHFPAGAEGIVSVFCLGADASGVTLRGLHYPLENSTLTAGFPLGISNHFTGKASDITVKSGSLLVIWDRKNGFPGRTAC